MTKNKDLDIDNNSQDGSKELEDLFALRKKLEEEKERLELIALEQEEKQEKLEKLEKKLSKKLGKNFTQESDNADQLPVSNKSDVNKIIIDEDFQFEIPVHGKIDVAVTVKFKKGQDVTDEYLLGHILNSDAKYRTI